MTKRILLESTGDGSHTLFVPELNEHYHSVNGAIQESQHVFIEAGLKHCSKNKISIFEVGFGTGLNAFLSLLYGMDSGKIISYSAIEFFPLPSNIIDSLNYAGQVSSDNEYIFKKLHSSDWNKKTEITPVFSLTKINADFRFFNNNSSELYDLVFFDAFAPEKQPEMWTQEIFDHLYVSTAPDGIIVTYCAKGEVRRMMQKSGYCVERLPGPPGKREMLRGTKQ